jgi:hypothetical protein
MRPFLMAFAPLALAGCLCTDPPTLQGRVVDPWNHPVDGVKVSQPGAETPAVSDDKGQFTLPLKLGKYKIKGEKEGFIPASREIEVKDEDASELRSLTIIPEPTNEGYHVVGPESYLQLNPEAVARVGNELQSFQGIRSAGNVEIDGKQARAVFHTSLKMDQVARLDIELHKLTFVKDMQVSTVEGAARVDVNLWTDAGKVDFEREELGSDDNYVFRMDALPSGTYAFVSMDLLDPKNAGFDTLPEQVRNVHPFTVK